MPKKPNTALRLAVPLILALAGIGVAISVAVNTTTQRQNTQSRVEQSKADRAAAQQALEAALSDGDEIETTAQADQPTEQAPAAETLPEPTETASAQQDPAETQADADQVAQPKTPAVTRGLRARVAQNITPSPIGSLVTTADDATERVTTAQITFSQIGAGIRALRLAGEYDNVQDRTDARLGEDVPPEAHVELQAAASLTTASGAQQFLVPFAALWIDIDGERVSLATSPDGRNMIWTETAPGAFEAIIEDEDGDPVVRVERAFTLPPASYDLQLAQRIVNLTDTPISARLVQTGPIDLAPDQNTYGGDKRRFRFGYLLSAEQDPTRQMVLADNFLTRRDNKSILGPRNEFGAYDAARPIWPNPESTKSDYSLVWAGVTSRYFGVAVHPEIDPANPPATKKLESIQRIERLMLNVRDASRPIAMRLTSPRVQIQPGADADLSYRIYAGPLSSAVIASNPTADAAGIEELVVFNFGGPCAFCTFTWLTDLLITTLRFLHGIFGDFALSVMGLVLVVRGVLHPVNRWSQIRVQRFGKQMGDMAPEMKKIQEKYKDDPKRVQEETAKVWREKGVNPAGLLGCLPMLLQSPIWIALYASLFFAYEMRHEPAFFGIFQTLTSGGWSFLEDLASPDAVYALPANLHFDLPLMGTINSINILPIVMGFVFFAHQKFLTPPTAATMTPEQQSQQKIIKVMMVVMMPVIMYNAPSALSIYFITNSTIAIFENSWIRAHIKKHDLLESPAKGDKPDKPKKPKKSGGFFDRLEKLAEQQKKTYEERMRQQQKAAGYRTGQKKETIEDRLRRRQQGK